MKKNLYSLALLLSASTLSLAQNQMVVSLNDGLDAKYYNTADVKVNIDSEKGSFTVTDLGGSVLDAFQNQVQKVSFVKGKVAIQQAQSWLRSAFVEWLPFEGATTYHVYIKGGQYADFTQLDQPLVRDYGSYGRADALGLKAGTYELKVVPVVGGEEKLDAARTVQGLQVRSFDCSGFAFQGDKTPGAYNADGTLKEGAVVVYITKDNIDTVELDVQTSSKGTKTHCVGLQDIINHGIKKGVDTRPFCFRLIGQIGIPATADKGDIVLDMNGKKVCAGLTVEGVGNDAVADGWGIRLKGCNYAELSNVGFLNCSSDEGDNVGLQQYNNYIWVHNCDMFYGHAGSDKDQVKGDGALDCKKSNYVTFSYNHFWDNGKCNLLGLSENSSDYYITYHHNWYDHSDSRHPRVRYYSAHVYNNYYDGNAKFGVGSCLASSVFVENNYFRNTNKPMLTSMQGSDIASGAGTFSKEDGGVIKAFGNEMAGMKSLRYVPYSKNQVEFDAYDAKTRDEKVPSAAKAKKGGAVYNNFDTDATLMYQYQPDAAADVPAIVKGKWGAGRMQHGDFQWQFDDAKDDASYDVNQALKDAVMGYKTKLVKIFGE